MVIDKTIIKELEYTYRRAFPYDLKRYLLVKYAEEPFPYEYSEQDLYMSIDEDLRDYEAGKLDVTIKSPSDRWEEERSYLQKLYIEKANEVRELEKYVTKLEHLLSKHGLKSSRMEERRTGDEEGPIF